MTRWPSQRTLAAIREATRLARREVTVLHGHSTAASLIAAAASWSSGVPSVYSPHFWAFERAGQPLVRHAMAAFERRMGRVHRLTVAVSESERLEAERAGISTPIRVVLTGLPPGRQEITRHAARRDLGIPEDARVAVWIGRRAAQKRPQDLAPLAALLRAGGVELIACGHGLPGSPEGEAFQAAGGRLVIAQDPDALCAAADVFVQTSAWESLPLTVLEAMRAALPVVAYRVGGLEAQVEDGSTGYLVEVAAVERLAERVIRVAHDDVERARLGEASRRRCVERFSLTGMVDAIAEAYRSVDAHALDP